jgi:hypothetical protein
MQWMGHHATERQEDFLEVGMKRLEIKRLQRFLTSLLTPRRHLHTDL